MKNFKLVVGMKFKSAIEFREVLRDCMVRMGYELVLKNNEKSRITVVCKKGCDWRIHASLVQGRPTFQIKTIKGAHTCARPHTNRFANYKYLGKRIEKIVRDNPDIKIDQLQNIILRKCAVYVGYCKVLRAKKAAVQKIRGVDGVQYQLLGDYCETVLKYNPGSKIIIRRREDFEPPTFDKLYYSLQAVKDSFLSGCRPIIGLDGCFLKTVHGGQLLVVVGRDGNDNMVSIALAVLQVENRENWTWFIRKLLEDIGGLGEDRWTFISDRQKGLIEALKDLVPNSQHSFVGILALMHALPTVKIEKKLEDFVDKYYGKSEYLRIYSHMIHVVPGQGD
ncbi:uncharacterized protein [Henckelia pumila]|uniref:uncharacterized protein n=1 Tax=Henckelia pumila TaxID=405737 RepID=UPI003C6DF18A